MFPSHVNIYEPTISLFLVIPVIPVIPPSPPVIPPSPQVLAKESIGRQQAIAGAQEDETRHQAALAREVAEKRVALAAVRDVESSAQSSRDKARSMDVEMQVRHLCNNSHSTFHIQCSEILLYTDIWIYGILHTVCIALDLQRWMSPVTL